MNTKHALLGLAMEQNAHYHAFRERLRRIVPYDSPYDLVDDLDALLEKAYEQGVSDENGFWNRTGRNTH